MTTPPEKRKRVSPETYRKHKRRFMLLMPLAVATLGATTLAIIEALLWLINGGDWFVWGLLIAASLFWGFMAHAGFTYWRAFEELEMASTASRDEQQRIQRLVDKPRKDTTPHAASRQQQADNA